MKIAIGADHGGYGLKETLKADLKKRGMAVEDVGCYSTEAVDYPDYARAVAVMVSEGLADQGVLICRTGIGMSMTANKYPRVRAALCLTPGMASAARNHNNANVLVLGSDLGDPAMAAAIVEAWCKAAFTDEARHHRRVDKINAVGGAAVEASAVSVTDPRVYEAIRNEEARERRTIGLIASENYASRAVREAQGSVMTNKYAEGYPGKRYYNGCEFVDVAESLAIERAKTLFGADHANVQPHCGSAANMAAFFSVLEPGDTILAMSLAHGGHLTHGHKLNFSGRFFNFVPYGVSQKTEVIDYDEVAALAKQHRPKLVVAGASAYPRILDFKRFREIADSVGAMLMVDMAHIVGLVAAGLHPNPVPYADFVTTTTHKTLRGPRGGMVLCRAKYAAALDKQVFPGLQGGPLMHVVAAKAVCLQEAFTPEYKAYQQQVVTNARLLAAHLEANRFRIVSGGTDNHLFLVDFSGTGLNGKDAAIALEKAGMIVNKNAIPFDLLPPAVTSGIRVGTPAITTRGFKEAEIGTLGKWMVKALQNPKDEKGLASIRAEVETFLEHYPVP